MDNETLALLKYCGAAGAGHFRKPRDRKELIEHCSTNERVWFLSLKGDARLAKVNGRVRTWKHNLARIEIPLRYGLYEYWTPGLQEGLTRILIPVKNKMER